MNADTKGSTRFYTDDEGANVCEEDDECDADAAGANYGWETWEGPRERDCNTSFKMVQCQLKHPIYLYACGSTLYIRYRHCLMLSLFQMDFGRRTLTIHACLPI